MLGIQVALYMANAGILIYDFVHNVDGSHFAFHNKIDLFYLIVIFWLFIASTYYLWHSTNRSIVVDLITYGVISVLLNLFVIWRSIDMLFISQTVVMPDRLPPDTDQSNKTFDLVFAILTYSGLGLSAVFTVFELSILPAVYEDIKDNIFLALGGNTSLWANFYNVTLTKSVLKLDLIFNCQFWTAFFFVVFDF